MKKASPLLTLFDEIQRRLTSGFQALRHLLFGHKEKVSSIDIHGDRAFCEAVKQALLLLRESDLSTFNLIDRHLNLIIQSGETLLDSHRDGAALALDGKEAKDASRTWLACLLACKAFQAKLFSVCKTQHKRFSKVPEAAYTGETTWNFMYECLKKIGGSYEEMQHLSEFIREEGERLETGSH